jgi:peroxiredoxin
MVTALIVNNNLSYCIPLEELEPYAGGFDETTGRSPWVRSVVERVETAKRTAAGKQFVNIGMPAPDGTVITLSDHAGKGKYVLLYFWASWSRACRAYNPQIAKLYGQYRNKGFEIVGISLDRYASEWTKAIETDVMTWPQMSDLKFWQSEGAKQYAVNSVPYAILLDRDGLILARGLQSGELEKILAELPDAEDKSVNRQTLKHSQ